MGYIPQFISILVPVSKEDTVQDPTVGISVGQVMSVSTRASN